eukprot:gnl/TRDRNA2_/TRDRNA2_39908_c0_seq1.p1 gnl/TRDRNA2_/TRDRNA2_39908_c0~~gnl/TRDRNA2_/TRDRNA2_39908_c0_seq1.p1  ORF type:complete len:182 (+),score=32.63 gnl/TRDRNA2_/TRDRNA2_39908_c0_seq1:46-591(+)
MAAAKLTVAHTWNGVALPAEEQSHVTVHPRASDSSCLQLDIDAPFYNDPGVPPEGTTNLWDYEVVEAFFLGDDDEYLELEFCPHGQYLVLQLKGCRNMVARDIPIDSFTVEFSEDKKRWQGRALVPFELFPASGVRRANAYAIHGSGDLRRYEALYPATNGEPTPDFHRLQYFESFELPSA